MKFTKMLTEYNDILDPRDIQEILNTGRNTVYNYLSSGKIRSLIIGGKYRIPKLYLLQFMYPEVDWLKEDD